MVFGRWTDWLLKTVFLKKSLVTEAVRQNVVELKVQYLPLRCRGEEV